MPTTPHAGLLLEAAGRQTDIMVQQVLALANLNSHAHNLAGIANLTQAALGFFSPLNADVRLHDLPAVARRDNAGNPQTHPLGKAVTLRKRPDAPHQVLLSAHLDTVFAIDDPFQHARREGDMLLGPGVADIKGGIVVMLHALQLFEQTAEAERLGWCVVLNPDEELGSPGSGGFLAQLAPQFEHGLVFEPPLEDGALVSSRRGSAAWDLVIRGRAEHTGRAYARGRNAVHHAARATCRLAALNDRAGVTANVGRIDGGGPINMTAPHAVVRFNTRVESVPLEAELKGALDELVDELNATDGYSAELFQVSYSPPKPVTPEIQAMMDLITACGQELGQDVVFRPTGGVCDGNKLAAAGLANVDTLGVRGGGLHSPEEWASVSSLPEKAALAACMLRGLARA